MKNMMVGTWLGQVAAYRPQLPIEDRLEELLWSWPIRRALTKHFPNPLWTYKGDDRETIARKVSVLDRVSQLAGEWYPFSSPSHGYDKPENRHFDDKCRDICDQLRELPGVHIPDPGDDRLWLALLLEHGWGVGHRDFRRDLQDEIVNPLSPSVRRQVCEIGERARDAAYLSVCISSTLKSVRQTKDSIEKFVSWLQGAEKHTPCVEA